MKRTLIACLTAALLALASTALAVDYLGWQNTSGTFASAQTTTGASANTVNMRPSTRWAVITLTYTISAGTATVLARARCNGVDWGVVDNSTKNLDFAGTTPGDDPPAVQLVSVLYPLCTFATYTTVCSATPCNVTTTWDAKPAAGN